MKNVAFTHWSASALRAIGVLFSQGPSSNVRTTSLARRKSCCGKCSEPKPGPPVVSISTVRVTPSALGLPGHGLGVGGARRENQQCECRSHAHGRPSPGRRIPSFDYFQWTMIAAARNATNQGRNNVKWQCGRVGAAIGRSLVKLGTDSYDGAVARQHRRAAAANLSRQLGSAPGKGRAVAS